MSLQDVPPQHAFWILGGKAIKNVRELEKALRSMKADTFSHHVNQNKNDFAKWVEHCVKDYQLASLMRTTTDQQNMKSVVERRIRELTRPAKKEPQIKEAPLPSIIRTKNVTRLSFAHKSPVVTTRKVTPLALTREKQEEPKKILHTPNKSKLRLSHEHPHREIYVHEVKKHHYAASTMFSFMILGVVLGVALVIITLAFT